MRYKTFARRSISTGQEVRLSFTAEHYKAAGVGYAPLCGLPTLEAHQLINRLNTEQTAHVYTL